MTTGIIDQNGTEINVGDIVHYRGDGLCAHGKVVKDDYYGYAIVDDRPKTKGRIYSLKNKGTYRIDKHIKESDDEWNRVTMIDVNGNTHKVTFKKEIEDIGDYPDEIPNQFDNLTGSMNV